MEQKKYCTEWLRSRYLFFFRNHLLYPHAIIPGASVVPREDPTVLFTTAGMHPLVPYLMGQPHPAGKRLADVQVCVRTTDIDDVGDDTHLTCFEMLGNWSLGDYFKQESIRMSWEFLTSPEWLGLDPKKLTVTCFEGDDQVAKDEESATVWEQLGVSPEHIFFYGREDNWWGPVGETGPCGPDTEIFYWTGEGDSDEAIKRGSEPVKDARWFEIWNNVFMQFDRRDDGTYEPLQQKNVDTGMGLERTVAALNGYKSVYETDELQAIRKQVINVSAIKDRPEELMNNRQAERSRRIVLDHLRAAVFIVAAGVSPSNTDRGYVLRRLIRRAMRHGRQLGISSDSDGVISNNYGQIIQAILDTLPVPYYKDIKEQAEQIKSVIQLELSKFNRTLERGLREFEKVALQLQSTNNQADETISPARDTARPIIDGTTTFHLYDTYGFPYEMTQELADERGLMVDRRGFEQAFKKHQEKSRTAAAGEFRSGLQDTSAQVVRYHTATHLLHQALRHILGEHVEQRGSNITAERLRFDFSHPQKLTVDELKRVTDLVNNKIRSGLEVTVAEMSPDQAKQSGALGFFGEKYGDRVTVYSIGSFSKEICTGPHVQNTLELGQFSIMKEESAGAGIRRIKAVLE